MPSDCDFFGYGGGGAPTAISDLLSPPAGSDGDYGYHAGSGRTYRYSSVYGAWIPGEVYEGTPAYICGLVGDDAAESGWATHTASSGTVTSDGTRITLDGTASGAALCWIYFDTVINRGAKWYFRGHFRVLTEKATNNVNGCPVLEFSTTTLAKRRALILHRGPTNQWQTFLGSAEIGEGNSQDGDLSTEKLVEWIVDHSDETLAGLTKSQVFVDGKLTCYDGATTDAGLAHFSPGLDGTIAIGDMTTGDVCSFTVKDFKAGSW